MDITLALQFHLIRKWITIDFPQIILNEAFQKSFEKYRKQIIDNIYDTTPTWDFIKRSCSVKTVERE